MLMRNCKVKIISLNNMLEKILIMSAVFIKEDCIHSIKNDPTSNSEDSNKFKDKNHTSQPSH